MPEGIEFAAANMLCAILFGAVIGMEREARRRMAGVRTNALVALGAASFVLFSSFVVGDASPTRVAAQVVSGIGFIGAGLIFRDGFTVHGLNTAATLWCSAAVGLMCGVGYLAHAALLTVFVMLINLGLRPLVHWVDRSFVSGRAPLRSFQMRAVCVPGREAEMRALVLAKLSVAGLRLTGIEARPATDGVHLTLSVAGEGLSESALETVVAMLAPEPGIVSVTWAGEDG